jgi:hypothetical protein
MNQSDNNILTLDQYGNTLTSSSNAAKQRGSGNFNPPPRWEQSIDRGNAMMNSYQIYNEGLPAPMDMNNNNETDFNSPSQMGDDLRKRAYVVGNTGLHAESGSWNRSEFEGAQNQYVEWALKSAIPGGITPTPLLIYFFSTENVDYIQNRIKNEVKKHTGTEINNQSIDELLIIMRSNLLYAYSGWLPNNSNKITDRGPKECSLEERLSRLNKSVIEESVKQVLSGINAYKQYTKDISSMPMPLSMPVYTSMSGSRELSENIGFNSGHERTIASQSYNQRFNII